MKNVHAMLGLFAVAAAVFFGLRSTSPSAALAPAPRRELPALQLIQRIPVPGVTGRIDHFTAFPKRRLLIFAALGNNSMETWAA